jgi:hypothetical protein
MDTHILSEGDPSRHQAGPAPAATAASFNPLCPPFCVRPEGAVYQWRKVPPSELSVALVADERSGGATRRAEAS